MMTTLKLVGLVGAILAGYTAGMLIGLNDDSAVMGAVGAMGWYLLSFTE
jgi:hypothetical protein